MYKSDKGIINLESQEIDSQRICNIIILTGGQPCIFFEFPDEMRLIIITGFISQISEISLSRSISQLFQKYMELDNITEFFRADSYRLNKSPFKLPLMIASKFC